jgi:hypothetical protein
MAEEKVMGRNTPDVPVKREEDPVGKLIKKRDQWRRDQAIRFFYEGRCPFPLLEVPAPGEVGVDMKATCRCGKRVAVTVRGLFAGHNPARRIRRSEIK